MVRLSVQGKAEVLMPARQEQIDRPRPQRSGGLVHGGLAVARVQDDQLKVALHARSANSAGL